MFMHVSYLMGSSQCVCDCWGKTACFETTWAVNLWCRGNWQNKNWGNRNQKWFECSSFSHPRTMFASELLFCNAQKNGLSSRGFCLTCSKWWTIRPGNCTSNGRGTTKSRRRSKVCRFRPWRTLAGVCGMIAAHWLKFVGWLPPRNRAFDIIAGLNRLQTEVPVDFDVGGQLFRADSPLFCTPLAWIGHIHFNIQEGGGCSPSTPRQILSLWCVLVEFFSLRPTLVTKDGPWVEKKNIAGIGLDHSQHSPHSFSNDTSQGEHRVFLRIQMNLRRC